jgi:hypothetical protein
MDTICIWISFGVVGRGGYAFGQGGGRETEDTLCGAKRSVGLQSSRTHTTAITTTSFGVNPAQQGHLYTNS